MLAFCLWAEGWADPKRLQEAADSPPRRWELVADEYKVERRRIPEYFGEDFWHNLRTWDVCREHGLPYPGGWATHPTVLIQMLQLFDAAKAKITNKKVEEDGNLRGTKIRNQSRNH